MRTETFKVVDQLSLPLPQFFDGDGTESLHMDMSFSILSILEELPSSFPVLISPEIDGISDNLSVPTMC